MIKGQWECFHQLNTCNRYFTMSELVEWNWIISRWGKQFPHFVCNSLLYCWRIILQKKTHADHKPLLIGTSVQVLFKSQQAVWTCLELNPLTLLKVNCIQSALQIQYYLLDIEMSGFLCVSSYNYIHYCYNMRKFWIQQEKLKMQNFTLTHGFSVLDWYFNDNIELFLIKHTVPVLTLQFE